MLKKTLNELVLALILGLLLQIPFAILAWNGLPMILSNFIYAGLVLLFLFLRNQREWGLLFQHSGWFNLALSLTVFAFIFLSNPYKVGLYNFWRVLAWILCLYLGSRAFWLGVVRNDTRRKKPLYGVLFTLFVVYGLSEMVFIHFRETHGNQPTLANLSWYRTYNGPYDPQLEIRDNIKPVGKAVHRIVFLGDSFLGGSGIRNIRDRYSNLVEEQLGEKYAVYNLARGGADTRQELSLLQYFRVKPDFVLLCYLGNDIQKAGKEAGYHYPNKHPYEQLPTILRLVLQRSYSLNWLYFHLVSAPQGSYADFNRQMYTDPVVWGSHQKDLQALLDYCAHQKIPIAVMVQPFMHAIQSSEYYIDPVRGFFEERGVPVLDASPVFQDIPVEELVVNPRDLHPNEKAHRLIADTLFHFLPKLSNFPH